MCVRTRTQAPARATYAHPTGSPKRKNEIKRRKTPKKTPKPGKILFHPSGACNIRGSHFAINISLLRSWGCAHVAHSGPGNMAFRRAVFRGARAGSNINDSIQFLRRSRKRSYQPMPSGVGTPRDERPHNPGHHARRTPRPKKPPLPSITTINPLYVNSGEAVNVAVNPRLQPWEHRATSHHTTPTTMRDVTHRATSHHATTMRDVAHTTTSHPAPKPPSIFSPPNSN